jgi:predicted GIY-YIG superfamily endonuclease
MDGDCYLICFSRNGRPRRYPRGRRPGHYLGYRFPSTTLGKRLWKHRRGMGACLTRAARMVGLSLTVVRTWEGVPVTFERDLKRRHRLHVLCPRCNPASWHRNGRHPNADDLFYEGQEQAA